MSRQPERASRPALLNAKEPGGDDGAVIVLDVDELQAQSVAPEPHRRPERRVLPEELLGMYYHG